MQMRKVTQILSDCRSTFQYVQSTEPLKCTKMNSK